MNELDQVKDYLQSLQNRIVAELEQLDGSGTFRRDTWDRPDGGGGLSCILSDGAVFEQAGVGFSHVFGDELPPSASKARPELAGQGFQAIGVSLVIHPLNPYVPTAHANFRYFSAGDSNASALNVALPRHLELSPRSMLPAPSRHFAQNPTLSHGLGQPRALLGQLFSLIPRSDNLINSCYIMTGVYGFFRCVGNCRYNVIRHNF